MFSQEAARRVLSQLIAHHHDSYPKEAVGLILGDSSILRLRNWSARPHRFITPGLNILWNLGWRAWRHGEGIALIYHSHVEAADPSETDKAFMKVLSHRWPHVGHFIFTPAGEYSAWYYEESE